MSSLKPYLFPLLFVLAIWPLNYVFNLPRLAADDEFTQIVSSERFHRWQSNKSADGCMALRSMPVVDVLFVGNSQAYSNLDMASLQAAWGDKKVALCAIPPWPSDTFSALFAYMAKHTIKPKRIIWLANAGTLFLPIDEARSRKSMENIFDNPTYLAERRAAWLDEVTVETDAEKQKQFTAMKRSIETLNAETVREIIEVEEIPNLIAMRRYGERARLNGRNNANFKYLCTAVRQAGIRFDVVMSPTSPVLPQFLAPVRKRLSLAGIASVGTYLRRQLPCAQQFIEKSFGEWGLDVRHYINRADLPDYDYSIWQSRESFAQKLEEWPKRRKARVYDADHLNKVGAEIFSRALAQEILP